MRRRRPGLIAAVPRSPLRWPAPYNALARLGRSRGQRSVVDPCDGVEAHGVGTVPLSLLILAGADLLRGPGQALVQTLDILVPVQVEICIEHPSVRGFLTRRAVIVMHRFQCRRDAAR